MRIRHTGYALTLGAAALCWATVAGASPPSESPAALEAHAESAPEESEGGDAAIRLSDASHRDPLLSFRFGGAQLDIPLLLRARFEDASAQTVDRYLSSYSPDAILDTSLRLGATLDARRSLQPIFLKAVYEHDFLSGAWTGDEPGIDGEGYPGQAGVDMHTLRNAWARVSFANFLTLGGGMMTSDWGLGLLANGGGQRWEPQRASFTDPRGGDRVLRGFLATGPYTRQKVKVALFADKVQHDDSMLDGDEATQFGVAATMDALDKASGDAFSGGVYGVYRNFDHDDGTETTIGAVDLFADMTLYTKWVRLNIAAEGVLIFGETGLGPDPVHPTHDVMQAGATARLGIDNGYLGGVIDFIYASGDENSGDDSQNAFKADPNSETGLLLFRHVLAAHTARAPVTASDPDLVGVPSEDLERLPTRGNATNTLAVFPRLWWRPARGLEAYVGALLAFTEVGFADPANSRFAGGVANSLGGEPGGYYGTEYDVGLRLRGAFYETLFQAALEGGIFIPGSAFNDRDGNTPGDVYCMRVLFGWAI